MPFEDLNEDQRRKVERKEDVLEEISRLTKRVRKEDFMYVCAERGKGCILIAFANLCVCAVVVCGSGRLTPSTLRFRYLLLCPLLTLF